MSSSSRRDNWGSAARIAIFIVGGEAVPEAEWAAMAPDCVSIHAARVSAPAPWASWNADRTEVELAADMRRGAEQLATLRPTVAVLAHTSSSVVGGDGWDAAAMRAMGAAFGGTTIARTNGQDTQDALAALGVRRPLLILPPWFPPPTLAAAGDYYARAGVAPAALHRLDPGPAWRDIPESGLYARGLGIAQDLELLVAQTLAAATSSPGASADGVLIAGTGFRSVGAIDHLERTLGRPVITANQASLWRALRLAGVGTRVAGYGRLLAT